MNEKKSNAATDGEELLPCCGGSLVKEDPKKTGGLTALQKEIILLSVSLVSVIISLILYELKIYSNTYFAVLDFAWVAIVICGYPILKKAFLSLKKHKITAPVLISTALIASIFMGFFTTFMPMASGHAAHESYFFVAGEVSFLMTLGGFIEDIVVRRSRSAINALLTLQPPQATLKLGTLFVPVDVSEIVVGDTVLVRAGETVPVDGLVSEGESSVDTASLTGEAIPVDVKKGSKVFAGTKNLSANLEITADKENADTVLSQITQYYKNAQAKRAPIVSVADKAASKIVPLAILAALLIFAIVAGTQSVTEGLRRGVAVLVVFCPCSLVLATPTAIAAAIGNAGRKGVLVKNGATMEALAPVNAVAFDKTGTLTTGNIWVERVFTWDYSEKELLRLAASAESASGHPIAAAVIAANKSALSEATDVVLTAGVGVAATVEGKKIEITKLSAAEEKYPDCIEKAKEINRSKSVIAVIIDDRPEGFISISDTVREKAKEAVNNLSETGYETVLLTGDNAYSAKTVSQSLGIDEYHYNLLPVDKAQIVSEMKANGRVVLTVGDGVNDAPMFAESGVSMSMGVMKNQVAIDSADISILDDDLTKVGHMLSLSKRMLKRIKLNIAISMTINVIAVVLSGLGYLNAVWGALLHNFTSVLVCISSALLIRDGKVSAKRAKE